MGGCDDRLMNRWIVDNGMNEWMKRRKEKGCESKRREWVDAKTDWWMDG